MSDLRTIGMKPMQDRPSPGRSIVVQMKDGQQLVCWTCYVRLPAEHREGLCIYHQGKLVDENDATGWWYNRVKGTPVLICGKRAL